MNHPSLSSFAHAAVVLGALLGGATATAADTGSACAGAPLTIAEHMANRSANTCPGANAGIDMLVMTDQTAVLDASASTDADGQRLQFAWRVVSAPQDSGVRIDDANAMRATFTPDLIGDYEFELSVTDASGAVSVDRVHFSTANVAPVANAGPDSTAAVGAYASLDALASYDFEGAPLKYRWQLVEQPAGSATQIQNVRDVNASLYLDAAGDYVAELVVNDGNADSVADRVRISTINSAPVAHAGRTRTLGPDSTLILDGAASHDVDGDALSYHWSLLSAPAGADVAMRGADGVAPTMMLREEGLYLFQLMVDDGTYLSAADTVVVEVVTRRLANVDINDYRHLSNRGGGDDTDGDGVPDPLDNCVLRANADQRDTDGDGLGNACDADLNNDGIVNAIDLGIFRGVFFTNDPDADLNGDGVVNPIDLGILKQSFFRPPGPAGTIIWVSLVDGDFANRLNWEPQTVPTAGTLALIDVGPAVTVTALSDNIVVKTLTNNESLVLQSGSFEATDMIENGGAITLINSTLNNTEIGPSLAGSGTITANAGAHTFNNAILGVDTTLNNGALVTVTNNLGVNATATLDAPSSATGFQFNGDQSLYGTGTVVFDSVDNSVITEPRLFPFNSTTLTIEPGITVRGSKGTIGQGFGNLVMNGSVIADVAGEAILVQGSLWSGTGSVAATGGGEIQFAGNFDNGGGALSMDTTGGAMRLLANAALRNTTINASAGTNMNVSAGASTFENLVFNGDMTHDNGALTTVIGGLTLNGMATINAPTIPTGFQFSGSQTLTGNGTVVFNGVGNSVVSEPRLFPFNSTVLTIDSGITVRGGKGTIGQGFADLIFLGDLIADIDGEQLQIGGANWSSNGSMQAVNNGRIVMFGNFDNGGDTLNVDTAGGEFSMLVNGALRNGTIDATAGSTLNFPSGASTLQALTMNIDTYHPNGAIGTVFDGLTLNGATLIEAPTLATGLQFSNTQTLDGTGTITIDGSGNSVISEPRLFPANSTVLTIGPGITVQGGNARLGQPFGSLVFNGTLDSNVNGQVMEIGGAPWSANQTLRARNGGEIHMFGAHENSAQSVALDGADGVVRMLVNSTLRDTVINGTSGTNVIFSSGTTTLDSVTLTADTTHENGANSTVTGLTMNGTATIVAPSLTTGMIFTTSQTLQGNLTVVFDSALNSVIGEPRLFPNNSTTLTVASTVTIEGGKAQVGNPFGNLVMNGTVNANVSGQPIRVIGATWSGTGTLSANNGGIIEMSGSLNNGGQTLTLDTAGGSSELLVNGALRNTTVNAVSGTDLLISSGASTFENLIFNGDMTLENAASTTVTGLTLNGTATINAPSSATGFTFSGTQTLSGNGTVVLNGVGNSVISEARLFAGNGTLLTIGPGITVTGGQGTIGNPFASIDIQGTVSADLGDFNLAGTARNDGGTLEALNGNTLNATSTLEALANASFSAAPGSTINAVTAMTLAFDSIVSLDIDGPGAAGTGQLTSGSLNMDGTLNVSAVNGFAPNPGDAFNLTSSSSNSGTFATVNSFGLGGGQSFVVSYPAGDAIATVN